MQSPGVVSHSTFSNTNNVKCMGCQESRLGAGAIGKGEERRGGGKKEWKEETEGELSTQERNLVSPMVFAQC